MSRFSTLDYYLLFGTVFDEMISGMSVLLDVDNLSDHDALQLMLFINFEHIGELERVFNNCISSAKANDMQLRKYQEHLTDKLLNVKLLHHDPACLNDKHLADINTYANSIVSACNNAANDALPKEKRIDSKRIPGWSEHVQPLRERSLIWHRIWIDCGRPRDGEVAKCMRRSRASYHNAIRKIRTNNSRTFRTCS